MFTRTLECNITEGVLYYMSLLPERVSVHFFLRQDVFKKFISRVATVHPTTFIDKMCTCIRKQDKGLWYTAYCSTQLIVG